ncbi:MAG: ribonuclease E/G, partial [Alphaproteobacteria bacterium]|nr:ribonuclease E/G [Alphaproteobacteria bacterium]
AAADLAAIRIDDPGAFAAARDYLARHLPAAAGRLVEHRGPGGLFETHGVDEAIETARGMRVDLASGGFLTIEPTEAITVIDVNSGSYVGASRPAETVRRLNLEAVETIARQMRLRNLAGLIAIDFVNMERAADWDAVAEAFRAAVADDRSPCRVIGKTAGGLFELTRRRRREPLHATLDEACAACGGSGRVASAETLAVEAIRSLERTAARTPPGALRVIAPEAVVALLEGAYRQDYEAAAARTGRRIALEPRPGPGREPIDVVLD